MITLRLDIKPIPHLEQLHIRQGKGVSMQNGAILTVCAEKIKMFNLYFFIVNFFKYSFSMSR